MASETEFSSVLERLVGNRDLSLFMPFLFGSNNNSNNNNNNNNPDGENQNERIFLVNPFTQSMVVIEGSSDLESLIRDLGIDDNNKEGGQPPASKAFIESLPSVEMKEEGCECVICLDGFEKGDLGKELPCKHNKFHGNCIEKWLGIHGSCPVCRHKMPVEEGVKNKPIRRQRQIWVGFSFNTNTTSDSHVSDHQGQVQED